MSTPTIPVRADDDLATALTLLARSGTILPRLPDRGSNAVPIGLLRARDGGVEAVGAIGASTATLLRDRSWIEAHPQGGWRISAGGISALRRHRSAPPALDAPAAVSPYTGSASPHDLDRPGINHAESPLAWLRYRKGKGGLPLISDAQFQAGERLRADFWRAQLTPRITASWSDVPSNGRQRRAAPGVGVEIADGVIAAKERVSKALVAVGPELAGILVDVCCHLKGLEGAEQIENLPQRSGKVVLLTALSALARHYGLVRPAAVEAQIAGRIRAWMAQGTSPNLRSWQDEA